MYAFPHTSTRGRGVLNPAHINSPKGTRCVVGRSLPALRLKPRDLYNTRCGFPSRWRMHPRFTHASRSSLQARRYSHCGPSPLTRTHARHEPNHDARSTRTRFTAVSRGQVSVFGRSDCQATRAALADPKRRHRSACRSPSRQRQQTYNHVPILVNPR